MSSGGRDARELCISIEGHAGLADIGPNAERPRESRRIRSEEHTSELQSHVNLVCRLLLEKKKKLITKLPVRLHLSHAGASLHSQRAGLATHESPTLDLCCQPCPI